MKYKISLTPSFVIALALFTGISTFFYQEKAYAYTLNYTGVDTSIPSAAMDLINLPVISSNNQKRPQIASSFSSAKNRLYKKIYKNQGLTLYTQCRWSKKKVDLESCGLQNSFTKKQIKRASRTEAEHVIPSSWMYKKNGKWRACLIESKQKKTNSRDYCQETDREFRNAHNDLVNLRPAVGQINAHRSNKPFSQSVKGHGQKTYQGNIGVAINSRAVAPHPSIRGDIARIAFYMNHTYKVVYSKRQMALFKAWHKEDPVSQNEIELNRLIHKAQGQSNMFVESIK